MCHVLFETQTDIQKCLFLLIKDNNYLLYISFYKILQDTGRIEL